MAKLTPVQTITDYNLTLSIEELKSLFWMAGKVSGDDRTTYREHASNIVDAIQECTGWNFSSNIPCERRFTGAINGCQRS